MEKESLLYLNHKNYLIQCTDKNNDKCVIFCSSNGLKLENDDYFEWQNISKHKLINETFGTVIYLRDVFFHSYVDGINKDINCIDEIVSLLKVLTKDKEIYAVGNSGGGYLAMILGSKLPNVKRVYSFGGLVSLYKWTGSNDNFTFDDVDAYQKHLHDEKYFKYFDISELPSNKECKTLHFYSSKNKPDTVQKQYMIEKQCGFCLFGFDSKIHGSTLNYFDIPKLLSCDDSHLEKIVKKYSSKDNIGKTGFSLTNLGLFGYIQEQFNRIKRRLKRKKHS